MHMFFRYSSSTNLHHRDVLEPLVNSSCLMSKISRRPWLGLRVDIHDRWQSIQGARNEGPMWLSCNDRQIPVCVSLAVASLVTSLTLLSFNRICSTMAAKYTLLLEMRISDWPIARSLATCLFCKIIKGQISVLGRSEFWRCHFHRTELSRTNCLRLNLGDIPSYKVFETELSFVFPLPHQWHLS